MDMGPYSGVDEMNDINITPVFYYTGMLLNVFVWAYGWWKVGNYIWSSAIQEKKKEQKETFNTVIYANKEKA